MDNDELQRQAWRALMDFLPRALVFLVEGKPNQRAEEVGSGTLLRTPAGRRILLTAAHVLDRHPTVEYAMGLYQMLPAMENVVAEVRSCPNADVCIAVLRDGLSEFALAEARPTSVVAVPAEAEFRTDDAYLVSGYPAKMVFEAHATPTGGGKPFRAQLFPPILYGCHVLGVDQQQRFEIDWFEGVPDASALHFPHRGSTPGKTERLPPPGGISGGALWRFLSPPKGELWSAVKAGRIVGVPCSWDRERTQYAESAAKWGQWFHDTVAELDNGSR